MFARKDHGRRCSALEDVAKFEVVGNNASCRPPELWIPALLSHHIVYKAAEDVSGSLVEVVKAALYLAARSSAMYCEKAGSGILVTYS